MKELKLLYSYLPTYYGITLYKSSQFNNCIRVISDNINVSKKYLPTLQKTLKKYKISSILVSTNIDVEYYLFIIKNKKDTMQALKTEYYFKLKELQYIKQQELKIMQEILNITQQLHKLKKE